MLSLSIKKGGILPQPTPLQPDAHCLSLSPLFCPLLIFMTHCCEREAAINHLGGAFTVRLLFLCHTIGIPPPTPCTSCYPSHLVVAPPSILNTAFAKITPPLHTRSFSFLLPPTPQKKTKTRDPFLTAYHHNTLP